MEPASLLLNDANLEEYLVLLHKAAKSIKFGRWNGNCRLVVLGEPFASYDQTVSSAEKTACRLFGLPRSSRAPIVASKKYIHVYANKEPSLSYRCLQLACNMGWSREITGKPPSSASAYGASTVKRAILFRLSLDQRRLARPLSLQS